MNLRTPRLLLRDFRAEDQPAVHAYASDPDVTRYTEWGPDTLNDTAAFLVQAVRDAQVLPRTRFALAVIRRDDEVLIGSVELRVTNEVHRRGEMGYVLARPHWGHGLATEAAAAVLRLGLDTLGLHKITATCDPDNTASARVLAKIGMRREGRLHDHLHIGGRWRDRLFFAAIAGRAPRPGDGFEIV
ncbi:GNAT family N-acetyltransferase [Micromonospora echinospora]|uniref:Protein N-acetyltransferase, RimJ/RimL family n=1 Tax=Micromonospora echinospora TaxID=1877 RepID=A0A1C4X6T9_MICEC|nr:GNAT family N-acetyltransferase [Micromonospora echinospora]OZV82213.1 GNAT family N-acetyltransferase [Micromonospora echinospora]SCF04164.1 Protein N-acetyltransferase, RimJ/RimL family [Micromonospora echinospora]